MTALSPGDWLSRIRALPRPPSGRLRIMNVCGGHERTITQAGLRTVLPDYLELIPGPGCPVCVCPEEDIHAAVALSLADDVIVATFGDMVRVPCNAPKREPRSLQAARALGGQVVPVASPGEVLALARRHMDKRVVFFAAGFETTTAPIAAMFSRPDLAGYRPPAGGWPGRLRCADRSGTRGHHHGRRAVALRGRGTCLAHRRGRLHPGPDPGGPLPGAPAGARPRYPTGERLSPVRQRRGQPSGA